MFLLHKATQVTPAATTNNLTESGLADLYAYPDVDRPHVRVNFVSSIDGSATADGKSGGLAGPGDRMLFGVLRSLADVIVVGARTAVVESYRPPTDTTLLLTSSTLDIPLDYSTLAADNVIVATSGSADADRRQALRDVGATIVDCGTNAVDLAVLLALCHDRGWLRVLCEGGPSLFGSFLEHDLVDELCLTTSPVLVAGGGSRIAHGAIAIEQRSMRLEHFVGDDDGYLYARWVRRA